jgi:hypothetical protein
MIQKRSTEGLTINNMKEQIKQIRVRIDGLSQLTQELKPINKNEEFKAFPEYINSKEIEKTYDSLILAKAWLGKVLGELGEDTPYANDGKRKSVEDIEPAADKGVVIPSQISREDAWENKTHIEKVDWLREEIAKLTTEFKDVWYNYFRGFNGFYYTVVFQYLSEARFWLGFELQRIKESGGN